MDEASLLRRYLHIFDFIQAQRLPWWLSGKESTCPRRRHRFDPWVGKIWEGNGNPLQYSCLGNPMNRGAWRAADHGVAKSWTWLMLLLSGSCWYLNLWPPIIRKGNVMRAGKVIYGGSLFRILILNWGFDPGLGLKGAKWRRMCQLTLNERSKDMEVGLYVRKLA